MFSNYRIDAAVLTIASILAEPLLSQDFIDDIKFAQMHASREQEPALEEMAPAIRRDLTVADRKLREGGTPFKHGPSVSTPLLYPPLPHLLRSSEQRAASDVHKQQQSC